MVRFNTRGPLLLLSEVSMEEDAQEGSQIRFTHLTLPGDTHPLDLHPWGPDTLCSVTPRDSKPSAPSTPGTLHPLHRDPGQRLSSLIMWRPPEQTRSRNHSRCPCRTDTTKDRKAAARRQSTWRTWRAVSPGNGGPSPKEEGSLFKGQGTHPQGGGQPTRGGQMNPHVGLNLTSGGSEPGENPGSKERTSQPREDLQPKRGAINWGDRGWGDRPRPRKESSEPW